MFGLNKIFPREFEYKSHGDILLVFKMCFNLFFIFLSLGPEFIKMFQNFHTTPRCCTLFETKILLVFRFLIYLFIIYLILYNSDLNSISERHNIIIYFLFETYFNFLLLNYQYYDVIHVVLSEKI